MNHSKLARQLRFAHAAEIAAFHAYEGHWRSVTNQAEQDYIKTIALDELKHIYDIEKMLDSLGWCTSARMDTVGKFVGEVIGWMCYHTGWRLPMMVAGLMEKIGTASYEKIALQAAEDGRYLMAQKLLEMGKVEAQHEEYFKNVRREKNGTL
jgi:rubrerythrin